jgi:hypothetical protein
MRCVWCHSLAHFFYKSTIEFAEPTCESHRFNGEFAVLHISYIEMGKVYVREWN